MNNLTLKMVDSAIFEIEWAMRYPDDNDKELGKALGYLEAAKAQLELEISNQKDICAASAVRSTAILNL